jgi:Xaa-Pro dipeptidase
MHAIPARLDKLRRLMSAQQLDAVALVPGASFRYLTGADHHLMERLMLLIVPLQGQPAIVIPNLESDLFASHGFEAAQFPWVDADGFDDALSRALAHLRLSEQRVGVEGKRIRFFEAEALRRHAPSLRLVDAQSTLAQMRLHKDADEIAALRRAIAISEAAFEQTLQAVRVGMTEVEIAGLLMRHLLEQGAHGLAFSPAVLAAGSSALPHGHPRDDYPLQPGDPLLFDFGASYGGYHADITRTVFVGEPNDHARAIYEAVRAANAAAHAAARPGVSADHVDVTTLGVLEAHGFRDYIVHKTGHGLGLDVHEDPYIMRGNMQTLEAGMVFTIEPGLYHPSVIGVRIEDDVVVTADSIESLTTFPRDLRVVGV